MVLADLVLPSRVNQTWQYSGMDSIDKCADVAHFKSYPHTVEYHYNSRGFRDLEWPDNLKNCIWCIGDSFTVGLGAAQSHTWPSLLQQATNTRTINISMDGASNDWIARRAVDIVQQINPESVVIHWSYLHRREETHAQAAERQWIEFYHNICDVNWPLCPGLADIATLPVEILNEIYGSHDSQWQQVSDEERRLNFIDSTTQQDIEHTVELIKQLPDCIHSFIPACVDQENEQAFESSVSALGFKVAETPKRLDRARDGNHYGPVTAQQLVTNIIPLL